MLSAIENELELCAPKPMVCVAKGLRYPQEADSPMWRACVVEEEPFSDVCDRYQWDLRTLCVHGLNANMMDRKLWFHPKLLTCLTGYTCAVFLDSMAISAAHFLHLKLSVDEYRLCGVVFRDVYKRYGRDVFVHEYTRLGSVDLRTAMLDTRLYGFDNEFLCQFNDERTLKELGWLSYYQMQHIPADNDAEMCV